VFADNNLGAKIDFSVLKRKTSSNIYLQRISELYFRQNDAALESKLNANNVAFYKMGTVTTEATLDLSTIRHC
jgi:phosphoribosylformylglycinamidine synthase